jgi:acyl dehydratase
MAVDTSIIGKPTGTSVITIERGPVSNFATAVKDKNPVYQDPNAATELGLDNIPTPPTYAFSMAHWGTFPEDQPNDAPTGNPVMTVIGNLMKTGGLILHGEQEFTYHKPLVVGTKLTSTGKISDIYEKTSGSGSVMTFISSETEYRDESGELVQTSVMTLIHKS